MFKLLVYFQSFMLGVCVSCCKIAFSILVSCNSWPVDGFVIQSRDLREPMF